VEWGAFFVKQARLLAGGVIYTLVLVPELGEQAAPKPLCNTELRHPTTRRRAIDRICFGGSSPPLYHRGITPGKKCEIGDAHR
jgi:hypothetical protein